VWQSLLVSAAAAVTLNRSFQTARGIIADLEIAEISNKKSTRKRKSPQREQII
jgi:hypothetical protein